MFISNRIQNNFFSKEYLWSSLQHETQKQAARGRSNPKWTLARRLADEPERSVGPELNKSNAPPL